MFTRKHKITDVALLEAMSHDDMPGIMSLGYQFLQETSHTVGSLFSEKPRWFRRAVIVKHQESGETLYLDAQYRISPHGDKIFDYFLAARKLSVERIPTST